MQIFFFFNDTATTEIYTLSLHDALPICAGIAGHDHGVERADVNAELQRTGRNHSADFSIDRKSTRLNSSHGYISYAVFCLKKKNESASLALPRGTRRISMRRISLTHTSN